MKFLPDLPASKGPGFTLYVYCHHDCGNYRGFQHEEIIEIFGEAATLGDLHKKLICSHCGNRFHEVKMVYFGMGRPDQPMRTSNS